MLFSQNSKMRKSSKTALVFNFGLPAVTTCFNAGICKIGCFAKQGAYRFSVVKNAYQRRYEASLKDDFAQVIQADLEALKLKAKRKNKQLIIRIHDSGDFYNNVYIAKWIAIMNDNLDVKFYAYTKMIAIFKTLDKRNILPDNFITIFSFGGLQDHLINVAIDRHSRIFKSIEELNQADYVSALDDDLVVLSCLKVGLVYHGAPKYRFSTAI